MRLGVVTTSYPREPGEPAGSFVSALNDWLLDSGHQIEVLAAADGRHTDDSWQPLPVQRVSAARGLFYQGGAPDALSAKGAMLAAGLFSAKMIWEVSRRLRHCDGLVAHWLVPSAVASVLAAPRKPIWAIAHGGDVHLLHKLGLSAAVARLLDRPNLHLNFVSQHLRDSFASSAGRAAENLVARAGVCPMGLDLAHFQGLAAGRVQNDSGVPHILFLGRLVSIKGVDLLLDALATIDGAFSLSIAGAGPEEAALRAQAQRLGVPVQWHGEVRGPARDELLTRADLVVVPSRIAGGRQEGMPLVALEALAAGAQLVVAQSGGLAEIPGSVCFQVPVSDVAALARVISEVLAGRRAEYSPGHWLEEHGWDALGPRLLPGLGRGDSYSC